MDGASKKSRKRSSGKTPAARQRLRENSVFYLDENLCYCKALIAVFLQEQIKYELHSSHFANKTEDTVWLEYVGQRRWIVLTKDKAQRFNELERVQLQKHKIRLFAFHSGNLSGD